MRPAEWSGDDVVDALLAPVEAPFAGEVIVVASPPGRPASLDPERRSRARERLATLPAVLVAAPDVELDDVADLVDLAVADDAELGDVAAMTTACPIATAAAAVLLRGSEERSVGHGLEVESAVFSALQAGPECAAWLASRSPKERGDADRPRVRVERTDEVVAVMLTRPEVRNALDVAMRDQLLDALAIVEADPALVLELRGDGPAFCAGGDLDEFGSRPDPATAHLVRMRRSIGAVLDRVSSRATAVVHGASAGSGVELAAFCGRVVARPDASFVLPECRLGLVPGAGGTVSVTRRIGRHRTAWLVLTGRAIDAPTALAWGLVDAVHALPSG